MNNKLNPSICVISVWGRHLPKLVKLLSEIHEQIYVIGIVSSVIASEKIEDEGHNIKLYRVFNRTNSCILIKIINHLLLQLRIFQYALLTSRVNNIFIFFIGGECLLIPIILLKLLGKTVILKPGGTVTKGYNIKRDPLSIFLLLQVSLNFFLADRIIIYSNVMIKELNVGQYHYKNIILHEHFVDLNKFKVDKKLDERSKLVGYIGRLSEEKGVLNLIGAISLVLKRGEDIHFVVCGNGVLVDGIKKTIKAKNLEENVKLTGRIPHEDVPQYLNEFRLLVLPSFTEGLPNIILEAMACGTPVLATPVGAILDIIMEGRTGFLLKSNDPKHIADRLVELLNKPELLEKVSINAHRYVKDNFTYEKTLASWQKVLKEIAIY